MCGIVGSIGNNGNSNLFDVFTSLLEHTEVRGRHATGVASLTDSTANYFKWALPATTFTATKGYNKVVTNDAQILLGHCRYATCGDPATVTNNHPFASKSGRFVFAHNGKVGTLKKLRSSGLDVSIESETDSEYLLRTIEALLEKGISVTKAIKDSVPLFPQAEFACILIDNYTRTLYLWRNYMRPLWVWDCTNLTGTHIVSSTKTIFQKSLLDVGYTQKQIDKIKGFQLQPYMVYSITLDGCISMSQIDESALGFPVLKQPKQSKSNYARPSALDALRGISGPTATGYTAYPFDTSLSMEEITAGLDDSGLDELFQTIIDDLSECRNSPEMTDALHDLLKDEDN